MIPWPLTKGKYRVLRSKGGFFWQGRGFISAAQSHRLAPMFPKVPRAGPDGCAYLSWLSNRAVRVDTTVPTQPLRAHQGFWTRSPTRIRIPLIGLLTNTTWDRPRRTQSTNWSTCGLSGRDEICWAKEAARQMVLLYKSKAHLLMKRKLIFDTP